MEHCPTSRARFVAPDITLARMNSDLSKTQAPLGRRVYLQGWFWASVLCPLLYLSAVVKMQVMSRGVFLLASIAGAIVGFVLLIIWKLARRGEMLFQLGSFMVNFVFVAYFVSLVTR